MEAARVMPGVTVLSETTVRDLSKSDFISTIILSILVCICLLIAYIYLRRSEFAENRGFLRLVRGIYAVVLAVVCITSVHGIRQYTTTHMEYSVAVEENVSFAEFKKYYQIVSRDMNIYTVRLWDTENS